jgi:hypothetical protein
MKPMEAFGSDRDHRTTPGGIRGLRVADADWCTRTASGYAQFPFEPCDARRHIGRFKTLARVERVTGDCDPGTFELFFDDGTSAYIKREDILCVEEPVTHADGSRT